MKKLIALPLLLLFIACNTKQETVLLDYNIDFVLQTLKSRQSVKIDSTGKGLIMTEHINNGVKLETFQLSDTDIRFINNEIPKALSACDSTDVQSPFDAPMYIMVLYKGDLKKELMSYSCTNNEIRDSFIYNSFLEVIKKQEIKNTFVARQRLILPPPLGLE